MFAISTNDYAIATGEKCSSPCSTDKDRLIFIKNQKNKRLLIEDELDKIPIKNKNNLIIIIKCLYSDYVEQLIEVKILNKNKVNDTLYLLNKDLKCDKYEIYTPINDSHHYPDIWDDFNNQPFYLICDECNNITNKHNNTFDNNYDCEFCINKQIYLNVPFVEKDDVKKLGGKWDNSKKKWYIFNCNKNKNIIFQKWDIYNELNTIELIGEDRNFGGNELFVDLIPSTCWFSNVRTSIRETDWDKLRMHIYERANYTCECCSINTKEDITNGRIEAHERWEYDDINKIQKLKRIVALCHQCHQLTHIGLAGIKGKYEEAITHLQKVRNFTEEECNKHIANAFKLQSKRSENNWELDLSLIINNGIKIKQK